MGSAAWTRPTPETVDLPVLFEPNLEFGLWSFIKVLDSELGTFHNSLKSPKISETGGLGYGVFRQVVSSMDCLSRCRPFLRGNLGAIAAGIRGFKPPKDSRSPERLRIFDIQCRKE